MVFSKVIEMDDRFDLSFDYEFSVETNKFELVGHVDIFEPNSLNDVESIPDRETAQEIDDHVMAWLDSEDPWLYCITYEGFADKYGTKPSALI